VRKLTGAFGGDAVAWTPGISEKRRVLPSAAAFAGSARSVVKIVYRAENIIDANLVKNALEHEGIPAYVSGQYLTGAVGELPPMALVNVMVAEVDWPRAREIAERIDADLAERRSSPEGHGGLAPDPA
jgi:hypothetical protein